MSEANRATEGAPASRAPMGSGGASPQRQEPMSEANRATDGAPASRAPMGSGGASPQRQEPMSEGSAETDHEVAVRVALETGELLIELRQRLLREGTSSWELESAGDSEAHRLIVTRLAEARPDDAVLSEEGRDDRRPGPRRTLLDRRPARRYPRVRSQAGQTGRSTSRCASTATPPSAPSPCPPWAWSLATEPAPPPLPPDQGPAPGDRLAGTPPPPRRWVAARSGGKMIAWARPGPRPWRW